MDQTRTYFKAMEKTPSQFYFFLAVGAVVVSAMLFLLGKRNWALFVGQWPPTIIATTLFYKLLQPSQEQLTEGMRQAAHEMRHATERMEKAA